MSKAGLLCLNHENSYLNAGKPWNTKSHSINEINVPFFYSLVLGLVLSYHRRGRFVYLFNLIIFLKDSYRSIISLSFQY